MIVEEAETFVIVDVLERLSRYTIFLPKHLAFCKFEENNNEKNTY